MKCITNSATPVLKPGHCLLKRMHYKSTSLSVGPTPGNSENVTK